jgi:hypothetical protein
MQSMPDVPGLCRFRPYRHCRLIDHAPALYDQARTPSCTMNRVTPAACEADTPVFHRCPTDPDCPYCNGTMEPEMALDWSFLDGAYCISLKSREDRASSAAAEFHRNGLCRKVMFYRPVKHPVKGVIGSWESHRAVGEHALQRRYKRTLIMEDDVSFINGLRAARVTSIARALERLPPDWMIFFLGHWPVWAYFVRRNVLRTGSACAHAYIASPRLLQWLHDHPWDAPGVRKMRLVGKGIDAAYAELPGTYALFPMIATQRASKSDHFSAGAKPNRKLRHLVTHSRYRDRMLAELMRPAEFIVAALSPAFFIARMTSRWRSHDADRGP